MKASRREYVVFRLFSLLLMVAVQSVWADDRQLKLVTTKTVFGKVHRGAYPESFIVSKDCAHVAYAVKDGQTWFMVLDGKELPKCDDLGGPAFSPDGKRLAYVAKRGDKLCVVVDGKDGKLYDGIGESIIVFSRDSKRVAYAGWDRGRWFVVVDGKEGPRYHALFIPVFSSDSKRVAYTVRQGGQYRVVVDGVEGKLYDGIGDKSMVFSPDSKRFAYWAKRDGKCVSVVDGKEGRQYDAMGKAPLFSPDSKRVAYKAKRDGMWRAVVNGEESKAYNRVNDLRFSADGKRFVHIAFDNKGNWVGLVSNGRQGKSFNDYGQGSLMLSPDGKRSAWVAFAGPRTSKMVLVVNDAALGPYDAVVPGTIRFSDDGRRLAFGVKRDKKTVLMIDKEEVGQFDRVHEVVFSSDGKHWACMAGRGKGTVFVVDGLAIKEEFFRVRGSKLVFDAPDRLHTIVFDDDRLVRLDLHFIDPEAWPEAPPEDATSPGKPEAAPKDGVAP